MWQMFDDGFTYLASQSWQSLIALFWFVIIFELPRYTITFLTAGILLPFHKRVRKPAPTAHHDGHCRAQ